MIVGFLFIAILLLYSLIGTFDENTLYYVLTIFLLIYAVFEIAYALGSDMKSPLLLPPVISSIVIFIISYVLYNFSLLTATSESAFDVLGESAMHYLNLAVLYSIVALYALWRGFYSPIAVRLSNGLSESPLISGLLRRRFEPRWIFIVAFIVISFLARIFQVSLGVFGYSSDYDQLLGHAAYKQYLDICVSLGRFALIGVALSFFSKPYDFKAHVTLIGIAIYEILFGFLLGFKGQTIMPIIIVGVCYYICKQKLPKSQIIIAVLVLHVAYAVIEPFRILRYAESQFDSKSIHSIVSTMSEARKYQGAYEAPEDKTGFMEKILARSSLTAYSARCVQHMTEEGLGPEAPHFLSELLWSPVCAVVPRLIWPTKPVSQLGLWFNREVLGANADNFTATGMGPVGYLYYAGGVWAIIIVFFLIGLLQRLIYSTFLVNGAAGGCIVFLGCLYGVAVIDSSAETVFTTTIRFLPLLIMGQTFLFKE